jgi:hypothetical protein
MNKNGNGYPGVYDLIISCPSCDWFQSTNSCVGECCITHRKLPKGIRQFTAQMIDDRWLVVIAISLTPSSSSTDGRNNSICIWRDINNDNMTWQPLIPLPTTSTLQHVTSVLVP